PTRRNIFLEPRVERRSSWQPSGHDITGGRFRFHDRDIGLTRNREQIVRGAACDRAITPEMKRQRNLMHDLAVNVQRAHASTYQRAALNRSAQTNNANVIGVIDL